MRLPSASFMPLLSIFALGLTACITGGDDTASDGTTSGSPSTNTDTQQPTTSETAPPTASETSPPTTSETSPTTSETSPTTMEPDDTTMGDPDLGSGLPQVVMETTLGTLVIELDDQAAPISVENFLAYTDAGFYDGSDGMGATIFHRVIAGFVAQGGGFTETAQMKATNPPIVLEAGNGLTNVRGTIAMARTNVRDSATSQFYFNLVDNGFLDDPPGYAVFGQIIDGLDVMDAIGAVEVDPEDVPVEPVTILSVAMQ